MKIFYFLLMTLLVTFELEAQELSPQKMAELRSVFNDNKMQSFMDGNPELTTEVVFLNSFDKLNPSDSLIFLLGFSGVREVRNENGGVIYYKLVSSSSEPEYRVRTIFFDGSKMTLEEINTIRKEILNNLANGGTFETQYEKYNMDDRQNYGDLGWVRAETLLEPFTSLVKIQKVGQVYSVDIPYMNWYYLAENLAEPVEQTRKKYLKVSVNN